MIDSHTHLMLCEAEDVALVDDAAAAGVSGMLNVGVDLAGSREAVRQSEVFPGVFAAVGIHPNAAGSFEPADVAALRELAGHPRCVAVGETGFDFYRDGASREDQEAAFRAQIGLARELDRALVIHAREADEEVLTVLESAAEGLRVILHCFSMPDQIGRCLAHPDWYVSFAGNLTYPRNAELRDAALRVPADRLLVETDAPYLSAQPIRGQRNTPAGVIHTAQALAELRQVPYAELEAGVEAAAAAAFRW